MHSFDGLTGTFRKCIQEMTNLLRKSAKFKFDVEGETSLFRTKEEID